MWGNAGEIVVQDIPSAPTTSLPADALVADGDPAFVIDVGAGRLLRANARGGAAWGLGPSPSGSCPETPLPLSLDSAMPGLLSLRALVTHNRSVDGYHPLTFWTRSGVASWLCTVRIRPDPTGAVHAHLTVAEGVAAASASELTAGVRAAPDAAHDRASYLGHGFPPDTLARLAHELRTPLAAIQSAAEAMEQGALGPPGGPVWRDYAQSIGDTARHALGVIEAMLEPAQAMHSLRQQTYTELDLNGIAAEAIRGAGPMAAKAGLVLRLDLAAALPHVFADRVAVRQILLNLIANAIAHAGEGCTMTLRSGFEAPAEAWLEAEDDGPGFSATVLACAMQQKGGDAGRSSGTGLGLILAKALAESNGARLLIANRVPRGASVRLSFGPSRLVPI